VKRILFVAEAVTLAQVVRLVTLARSLPPSEFEVHFAVAPFAWPGIALDGFAIHTIAGRSPAQMERALRLGTRLYDRRTLARYVEDDLQLLDEVEPDVVVGDFRWSLSTSAELRRIPSITLINAYWSPYAIRDGFPVPNHLIAHLLGERLAARYVPRALPWTFRWLSKPLDSVRRAHGLAPLGDLFRLLTDGTVTIYPDVPELVPTRGLPPHHRFIGPVLWQPAVNLPSWWSRLGRGPVVYLTLGSSGHSRLLEAAVAVLARLPVQLVVATAGRARLGNVPANVFVSDYLPGDAAVERADVVVTNGGTSTGYQALSRGRPVIGVPWNLDQLLATQAIDRAGCGTSVPSTPRGITALAERVEEALGGAFREGVGRIRAALARLDSKSEFLEIVNHAASFRSVRNS
jgi:UDP:flavonoid glycosyltransferase YjiC (YdhE family)